MFWTKLAKKGLKQKKWKYHQIYLILNSVGAKFHLKLTISNINEKKNENRYRILYIQNSLGSKFQLQQINLIFQTNFSGKRILLIKNRKSEHHHWILHVQISLSIKFQLKLKFFFGQISPKRALPAMKM